MSPGRLSGTQRWQHELKSKNLLDKQPHEYFTQLDEVQGLPPDALDDPASYHSKYLYLYLRHQAWFGQSVENDSPRNPRVLAAERWTRFLLDTSQSASVVAEIVAADKRFFADGRTLAPREWTNQMGTPNEKPRSWRKVLRCLDECGCDVQQLTAVEFELALVVFDWWCDGSPNDPQTAPRAISFW